MICSILQDSTLFYPTVSYVQYIVVLNLVPISARADLISLEDAMEELELGPNGGLVYCMEYLLDNMDWLKDELDKFDDDEYIIFDCPGQVRVFVDINLLPPDL